MARKTKIKHVKSEMEEIVYIECDLCHKRAPNPDGTENEWLPKSDQYGVATTEIRMETGMRYPDSGDMEVVQFDICPTCFKEKLIPFFAEDGGSLPRTHKVQY